MNLLTSIDATMNLAVDTAANIANFYFEKKKNIETKENIKYDIVTNVDKLIENVVVDIILNQFPDHNILTEESRSENNNSRYTWILDPIDGTFNYAHQYPYYSISLGLEFDGIIMQGAVVAPALKEKFTAQKNLGSFLNGNPIKCKPRETFPGALIASSMTYIDAPKLHSEYSMMPRCYGSAALDLCYLAMGRIDAVLFKKIQPWDVCAGTLIAEEAGANFLRGTNDIYNGSLYVTTSKLGKKFDKILNGIIR